MKGDLRQVWPPPARGVAVITPPPVPPMERERAWLRWQLVEQEAVITTLQRTVSDLAEQVAALGTALGQAEADRAHWCRYAARLEVTLMALAALEEAT